MLKIITAVLFLSVSTATAEEQTYFEKILAENVLVLISGDTVSLAGVLPHPYTVAAAQVGAQLSGPEYLESILKGKLFKLVDTQEQSLPYRSVIISVGDSLQVNLKMVADGFALADLSVSYQFSEDFLYAELLARRQKFGLWSLSSSFLPALKEKSVSQEQLSEKSDKDDSDEETKEERITRLRRDMKTLGKDPKDIDGAVVYIRLDENHFHRENCPILDKKGLAVSKAEAKEFKFRACSRCRPMGD